MSLLEHTLAKIAERQIITPLILLDFIFTYSLKFRNFRLQNSFSTASARSGPKRRNLGTVYNFLHEKLYTVPKIPCKAAMAAWAFWRKMPASASNPARVPPGPALKMNEYGPARTSLGRSWRPTRKAAAARLSRGIGALAMWEQKSRRRPRRLAPARWGVCARPRPRRRWESRPIRACRAPVNGTSVSCNRSTSVSFLRECCSPNGPRGAE